MGTKEPVLLAGGVSSLLAAAGALAVFYGWMNADEVALWIAFATIAGTMAAASWARSQVTSEETLNQAGTTKEAVKEVAETPNMILVPQGTGDGGPSAKRGA